MTYSSLNEVVQDLQTEAGMTQKVLAVLTDESLATEAVADHWSVGKLAWHLAGAYHAFLETAGLQFKGMEHQAPAPASAERIADTYRSTAEAAIAAIQSQWSDATLQERRNMWGVMDMSIPAVVTMFVRHQAHHRGQLTILMRLAGLKVPGIYGPSKEERAAMNAK